MKQKTIVEIGDILLHILDEMFTYGHFMSQERAKILHDEIKHLVQENEEPADNDCDCHCHHGSPCKVNTVHCVHCL